MLCCTLNPHTRFSFNLFISISPSIHSSIHSFIHPFNAVLINNIGRKPAAESEPPSKRIAQNRAAQKAYRQRKEGRLQELENKVRELEITTTLSTQASEFQRMVDENKALRSRLQQLEEENENLKQQVREGTNRWGESEFRRERDDKMFTKTRRM